MTDFDILNYSVEELINIIGLGGEIPLANEQIEEKIKSLKEQFEEKYLKDEEIIKVNSILSSFNGENGITDDDFIASTSFKEKLVNIIKHFGFSKKWNDWSKSNRAVEFKTQYYKLLNSNGNFNKYMSDKLKEDITISIFNTAVKDAFNAKEAFIFFFDEIANKLREYKKDESAVDYYKEMEENEKSLLEGDFMDENETILARGNRAMPIWDRTLFKPGATVPADYKNPILVKTIEKTINIDSRYRAIADPIVCIRCPDTLELYNIPSQKGIPVVASNGDGKILIVGISGNQLRQLDSVGTTRDISFNDFIPDINKEWVDLTMNYPGSSMAICNKNYIWYSNTSGADNSWLKSKVSYLTDTDLSNSDISANWTAISSDISGQNLFATRSPEVNVGRNDLFQKGGVCYSTDYAKTWVDLSDVTINIPDGPHDMNQDWIDIVITGDGTKVYGIYKKDSNYYIAKNDGDSWNVINNDSDYTEYEELIGYHWKKIVTNFYGNKVFIIGYNPDDLEDEIWRSFNSGLNWSKIIIPNPLSDIHSLTCSLDGLKLAIWTTNETSFANLRFSENGGESWNDASILQNVNGQANIVISGDGDRILGSDVSGRIFTSKKCVEKDLTMFDSPSNFTLNLSEKIENIYSMVFKSIELPHSWNAFNNNEGTCSFYITTDTTSDPIRIDISENNYHYSRVHDVGSDSSDSLDIITALNTAIQNAHGDLKFTDQKTVVFSYKSSHNISIKNTTDKKITLFWYYGDEEKNNTCAYGAKVNYNLGWLLGFRKTLTALPNDTPVISEAKLNLNPTKYVFISLDEFTNNKLTDTCISYENNSASFNMPSYYVKTTMGIEMESSGIRKGGEGDKCWKGEADPQAGLCGKRVANPDLLSNLTAKQRYTIENLRNAISGTKNNQYKSPIIPNLLSKVTLKYNNILPPSLQYTIANRAESDVERKYFGPITLRKFHIRLLNERGYEINMNNSDWSFSLVVKQLYNNH
jgi:hypothetical protein